MSKPSSSGIARPIMAAEGEGFHYSDSAIETALMLKAVFKLPLRALKASSTRCSS
jgi:hypothetical protein